MINWNKPIETRDGRKVRVLCRDVKERFPVLALVTQPSGKENVEHYMSNGKFFDSEEASPVDLVNVPQRFSGAKWANSGDVRIRDTRELADSGAMNFRVGCVEFGHNIQEGGGLPAQTNKGVSQLITLQYWINLYANRSPTFHSSRESADGCAAGERRIACVFGYRQIEEGHGLTKNKK